MLANTIWQSFNQFDFNSFIIKPGRKLLRNCNNQLTGLLFFMRHFLRSCFKGITSILIVFFLFAVVIILSFNSWQKFKCDCFKGSGTSAFYYMFTNVKMKSEPENIHLEGKVWGPLYYFDIKYFDSELIRDLNATSEAGVFLNKSADMVPSKLHRRVLHDLFLAFDDLWRLQLGHLYFLWSGTLLGAYRHAGRVPHDDDIDLLVDVKYMKKFYSYLNGSNLTAVNFGAVRKVFFRNLSLSINTPIGRYPSIDVVFYRFDKSGSRMSALAQPLNQRTTNYFPNIYMPYEGRLAPAPRCVSRALEEYFRNDYESNCCNHGYNHRLESFRKRGSYCINCTSLYGLLPFTTWKRLNATHSQQLVLPPRLKKSDTTSWKPGLILPMPDCM